MVVKLGDVMEDDDDDVVMGVEKGVEVERCVGEFDGQMGLVELGWLSWWI